MGIKAKDMNKVLPSAVAESYEIIGSKIFLSHKVVTKYGEFNFKEITVKQAAALVKLQCPWIAERKKGTSGSEGNPKNDK